MLPLLLLVQVVQAPSLAEALLGVLCKCHRGCGADNGVDDAGSGSSSSLMLGYPPPVVVNKRGR